jgi:hypothetical protein
MIKTLVLGTIVISLGACSSLTTSEAPGDPQIIQGENWTFIQNEPLHALKEAERQGFKWGKGQVAHY